MFTRRKRVQGLAEQPKPEDTRRRILVFGSRSDGNHWRGVARTAKLQWGAIQGQAEGLQGDSYAIITRAPNWREQPVSIKQIAEGVDRFKQFAREHPEMVFLVSALGCGLAGFSPEKIAPLLHDAPDNVILPELFYVAIKVYRELLNKAIERNGHAESNRPGPSGGPPPEVPEGAAE
jgi:hypothetical protein